MPVSAVALKPAAVTPIFVDESGRRSRRLHWAGRVVAICILVYFFLLVASFARAPWVPHLTLPGIGPVLADPGPQAPLTLGRDSVTAPAPDLKTTVPPGRAASPPTTTVQGSPLVVTPPAATPTTPSPPAVTSATPGPAAGPVTTIGSSGPGLGRGGNAGPAPGRPGPPAPTAAPTTTVARSPGRSANAPGRF